MMVSVVKEVMKCKVNFKHGYITVLLTEYICTGGILFFCSLPVFVTFADRNNESALNQDFEGNCLEQQQTRFEPPSTGAQGKQRH